MGGAADSGALAGVDRRLREELGMPFVPTVFQLLAQHPHYLLAATDALLTVAPAGATEVAARTRAAGARAAASLVREPLIPGEETAPVVALFERYNEANSRSLLLTTPMAGTLVTGARVMEPPLPPPAGTVTDDLLEDIRACHGDFNVPALWRELAQDWPGVARPGWALVRTLPPQPEFAEALQAVLALAREGVAGRVAPTPVDVGCSAQETREIERILAWYQLVIPTMIVEIECLRRALELAR